MLHRLSVLALVALATATLATAGRAGSFDLIVADSIYVFVGPANSGFATGNDVGLVVNTGAIDIGETDLSVASFQVTSSNPQVEAMPFLNNAHLLAPIEPDEAVGSWTSEFSNLLPLVLPGETLRNTYPVGFYGLAMGYPVDHEGTTSFTVKVTIGTEVAEYPLVVIVQRYGTDFEMYVPHAVRVSSVPIPTPVRAGTWGEIKRRYR